MQTMTHPGIRASTADRGHAAATLATRIAGALLALAIATVHVADQGGVTTLSSPHWMGWSFRLIEVGGVLTAAALLLPWPDRLRAAWPGTAQLCWAAALLLGTGPLTGYIASRTVGLPGDPHDVGNWGYWVGTVSLLVEAALIALSVSTLLALRRRPGPAGPLAAR